MCGIFGVISNKTKSSDQKQIKTLTTNLFKYSQTRGIDSAGIVYSDGTDFTLYKKDISGEDFVRSEPFIQIQKKIYTKESIDIRFIGHCRMVTNGTEENPLNNQPVEKNGVAVVHNGIVCNIEDLWKKFPQFQRKAEVDSEIFTDLINFQGASLIASVEKIQQAFLQIEGSASIAMLDKIGSKLVLATNTGSVFYSYNKDQQLFVFASEDFILKTALQVSGYEIKDFPINHLGSRSGLIVETENLNIEKFTLKYQAPKGIVPEHFHILKSDLLIESQQLVYRTEKIKKLKRCSKCVLPESFPFITFDEAGVCNYCKRYKTSSWADRSSELVDFVNSTKSKSNSLFDCIVPFSGGRDSSYGLHYLVKELQFKPITYTYDWGMVTDLARRNISRICGELGVENILISADIKRKRQNIQKNVSAWLKNPVLGLVPLFMAGDKQFLFYVNKIKEQTGVSVDIWMPNKLENTEFKTGFCGIKPADKSRIDALPLKAKLDMIFFYGANFLQNPNYLNSSLFDSFFAYFSYYFEPRTHYTVLFDYIPWNESHINQTLIQNYNWETSPDSYSTWRIGDGTAAFYNYIYNTIAGFSEVDTFRSNQIREGMIDRETALKLIEKENAPRYESIKWYLETIGIDFKTTIDIINRQKTLY